MKSVKAALVASLVMLCGGVWVAKSTTLIDAQTQTASTNGSAVRPVASGDSAMLWLLAVNNSGTSPTLDVTVQHSPDCTNWVTLETLSQCTTSTCVRTAHLNSDTTKIMPCLRAVTTLGGTSPSYTITARVYHD